VLRAKVSVFVELWEKNRRVRTQAALTQGYERRLGHAAARLEHILSLIEETDGDQAVREELLAVLRTLRDEDR
jgi:hypothetical protein